MRFLGVEGALRAPEGGAPGSVLDLGLEWGSELGLETPRPGFLRIPPPCTGLKNRRSPTAAAGAQPASDAGAEVDPGAGRFFEAEESIDEKGNGSLIVQHPTTLQECGVLLVVLV